MFTDKCLLVYPSGEALGTLYPEWRSGWKEKMSQSGGGSRVGNEKGGRGGVFGFIKTLGGVGALSLCG